MNFFHLHDQTRSCRATGKKCTFQHIKTVMTATFKTECAKCGGEHFIDIPVIHPSRPPIVPNTVHSTLCAGCIWKITPGRPKTGQKAGAILPPQGHPAHPACGEDLA